MELLKRSNMLLKKKKKKVLFGMLEAEYMLSQWLPSWDPILTFL